jgi:hypothetical protein
MVGNDSPVGVPNWPLMLNEAQAAAYVGLLVRDFGKCVKSGEIPAPQQLCSRSLWNRKHIDRHLDATMSVVSQEADDLTTALEKWSQSCQ